MKLVENKNYGCESVTSGYLTKFAKTHKLANPILVPIRKGGLTGSGDANQCHTNAMLLAYRYGGTVLNGYGADRSEGRTDINRSVLWTHTVWVTPEGNAVCPTAHNIRPNDDDFQFIPCFEHDENTVRDFFENDAAPTLCRNLIYSPLDSYYVLALDGEWSSQIFGYSIMTKHHWKRVIRDLAKKGLAGTRKHPLRAALLSKAVFASDITLEWYFDENKQDFCHKVFPNGLQGGLNAV